MTAAPTLAGRSPALIGPNAVLQMAAAMDRRLGRESREIIMRAAGIAIMPSGRDMIPERDAMRLHQALLALAPRHAREIAREAGIGTADYIIANRIPAPARWLLRLLPARLAAPLLMAAIRKHAWTFVGEGAFSAETPWSFSIDRGGLSEASPPPTAYVWYAAVFSRLYQVLVSRRCECRDCQSGAWHSPRHSFRIAPFAV